jgi:hypothetical protein
MNLAAREKELRALAKERGVDWKERAKDLPDDPRLRIAALAMLLRIDPMEALRADGPAKTLEAEARKKQRAGEEYQRDQLKFLRDHGLDVGQKD